MLSKVGSECSHLSHRRDQAVACSALDPRQPSSTAVGKWQKACCVESSMLWTPPEVDLIYSVYT